MGPGPILLIWEEVLGRMKMFWLEGLSQADFERIVAAHGTYINSEDENEHTRWLLDFLFEQDTGKPKRDPCQSLQDLATEPVELVRGCTVVISGFIMM